MTSARTLIKALHDHWPLVEALVLKTREFPYLEPEVLSRTALVIHGQDRALADEAVRQLMAKDILLAVEGKSERQIHGAVRDFVLSLAQEHELGLAETLRAEIGELKRLGEQIQDALAHEDLSAMQHPLGRLGNRIQSITTRLQHDRQAILNIADRAKTQPPGIPLSERYREVIESYDRYLEPMTQLLEREQGGFAELTERIEDQITEAGRLAQRHGALATQRRALANTAYALRSLRSLVRETLTEGTETLLPLRQEYMKNTELAVAVATVLGVARKKGMRSAIPSGRLALVEGSRHRRVVPGRFTKAYMAAVLNFTPRAVEFPEGPDGPPVQTYRIRFEKVLARIQESLPIPSLMPWLKESFPDLDEKDLLRLYHELVRHFGDRSVLQPAQALERMPEHFLRYHPHSLEDLP